MSFTKQKETSLLNNQKILAIIPARSGSKRLPNKNLKIFCKKPLLAYTCIAANESSYIDYSIVSTDSIEIIDEAKKYNVEGPFVRPKNLSTDKSEMFPVIKHALDSIEKSYDVIVLLQPTSPLRESSDIDIALKLFFNNNAKPLVSACKLSHPKEWIIPLSNNMLLGNYAKNFNSGKRSQDYNDSYLINGAIFISMVDEFLLKKTFFTKETIIYPMKKSRSIDIDNEDDFALAEYYMKNGYN